MSAQAELLIRKLPSSGSGGVPQEQFGVLAEYVIEVSSLFAKAGHADAGNRGKGGGVIFYVERCGAEKIILKKVLALAAVGGGQ